MPSPFPGMDPYLEAPDIWPDFHDHLASEIGAHLNQILPPQYFARLEMRPEIGISEVRVVREPFRHHYIEIREADREHKLITLIEILSPSNKRHGPDRECYEQKQQEVLN